VLIDGVPTERLLDVEAESAQRYYAKRGGGARHTSRRTKP
jgi:hypothetical protein